MDRFGPGYQREDRFDRPLDDCWEMIPEKGWTFDMTPGCARFVNRSQAKAEIFVRPCSIPGDTVEFRLKPGDLRNGVFLFGFLAGFEFVTFELDLTTGALRILTHEFHKEQPRFSAKVATDFSRITVVRERDELPGLPYEGCRVELRLDDRLVAQVGQIDFLPESLFMFGLKGPGELSLAAFSITGPQRPRPEYVRVGLWQQGNKPTTAENVNALIPGVRQAAEAGVEILLTPETSLTGLRPDDPELSNRDLIQSELRRFQDAVRRIKSAPYTLIGYPDWIPGSEVDGATLDSVKVNSHRFVRPDGSLGPRMAKVHSCDEGLWHGRHYNLQRVAGVEVALGVCHDGHYQDVWSVGVMGGARLCMHPAGSGGPVGQPIANILAGYRGLGTGLDSYWVRVNSGGGSAIIYPASNRKQPNTILAVPDDLTEKNPTYPNYSSMGDLLAHARLRLWDASGTFPMRTLRGGRKAYETWSKLVPEIQDV